MEHPGTMVSWMHEAIRNLPAFLSDPIFWGAVFALIVLLILYSLVSSVRRMGERFASVSEELSAIRVSLKKMERSLGKVDPVRVRDEETGTSVLDLPFRMESDRSG